MTKFESYSFFLSTDNKNGSNEEMKREIFVSKRKQGRSSLVESDDGRRKGRRRKLCG